MAVYLDSTSAGGFSVDSHKPGLLGWHRGELAIQDKLGFKQDVDDSYMIARSWLTDQHRWFHTRSISFLPLALKDSDGRVWTSILCGRDGRPGFVSSPTDTTLRVNAVTWPGDPSRRVLQSDKVGRGSDKTLVAGVGVELTTRRRNKLAGIASSATWQGEEALSLNIDISTALGNCPKYISVRDLIGNEASPKVEAESLRMGPDDTLPRNVIDFILQQDSLYLSTSYVALTSESNEIPSCLGCNHRGGRPGFVRVRGDRRTIVLPDYSGNRFMSSLGNILTDPVAGVAFPSFKDGSVLYVTGTAENVFGPEAAAIMPRTRVLTLVKVTGYTLVRNALPFQEDPNSLEASPYSPPVRYLTDERQPPPPLDATAVLVNTKIHGGRRDLATFTFETSMPISQTPGQYVILEAIDPDEIGYTHSTRAGEEKIVNEDGIRTWTMSSAPSSKSAFKFSITVRKIGRATKHLFNLADYFEDSPEAYQNRRVELPLLGVGGDFVLPQTPQRTLWIAGGIGITPFLSFLEGLARGVVPRGDDEDALWQCELHASTREPDILFSLISNAISVSSSNKPTPFQLVLHIYSRDVQSLNSLPAPSTSTKVQIVTHEGRLTRDSFLTLDTKGLGSVYLCGPPSFEEEVMQGLKQVGVPETLVRRENFDY